MPFRVRDFIWPGGVDASQVPAAEPTTEIGGICKEPGLEMLLGVCELYRRHDVVTQSSRQFPFKRTDHVIGSFSIGVYKNDKLVRRGGEVAIPSRLYESLRHWDAQLQVAPRIAYLDHRDSQSPKMAHEVRQRPSLGFARSDDDYAFTHSG